MFVVNLNCSDSKGSSRFPHEAAGNGHSCEKLVNRTPQFANHTTVSTALASYPGSGNTLCRLMIETLSGIWSGSIYGDQSLYLGKHYSFRGEMTTSNVIVYKTHGPWHGHAVGKCKRVILLLRNPMKAIPSYYSWYDNTRKNIHAATQHRVQGSEKLWVQWRDMHFKSELEDWIRHVRYWMDSFPKHQRLVINYEDITDTDKGFKTIVMLGNFLHVQVNDYVAKCVWESVINGTSKEIKRIHEYEPWFTSDQQSSVRNALIHIMNVYKKNVPFVRVMTSVFGELTNKTAANENK